MKATSWACLCLLAASAHGEWIQTVGLSERCIALGGACVAKADDYGAYYHNPAAAAAFEKAVFGGNFRILDTTRLDLRDSAGNQSVPKTNAEGKVAIAPTLAGYFPLKDRITFGVGLGAPFAITADWDNDEGMHRYSMSEQALFVLDLTPTVAFAVNDRLSLGVGLNLVALKHLRLETLIPQSFGAALPPALGGAGVVIPTTPDSLIIGSITLETNGDVNLGIPPDEFAFVLDEFALTLGLQYRANDRLTVGAVYRSQTDSKWEGDVTLEIGGVPQTVGFDLDLDLPGHLQAGFAYDLIPDQLSWSFDIQWTRWSQADGIGSPAVIAFNAPLVGFINDLQIDYDGNDTLTVRTGLEYRIDERWSLLAGYARDGAIFDDDRVDILSYDSDRNILSGGLQYDRRDPQSGQGWTLIGGLQTMLYKERKIEAGESQNLGGVSLPALLDADTLTFTANRGDFEYGGSIWALSFSFQRSF